MKYYYGITITNDIFTNRNSAFALQHPGWDQGAQNGNFHLNFNYSALHWNYLCRLMNHSNSIKEK